MSIMSDKSADDLDGSLSGSNDEDNSTDSNDSEDREDENKQDKDQESEDNLDKDVVGLNKIDDKENENSGSLNRGKCRYIIIQLKLITSAYMIYQTIVEALLWSLLEIDNLILLLSRSRMMFT
jgi:hypothetical protein